MTTISVDEDPCSPQSKLVAVAVIAFEASPAFLPLPGASWLTTHQFRSAVAPFRVVAWPATYHFHCPSFLLAGYRFPRAASKCYFLPSPKRAYCRQVLVVYHQFRLRGSPQTFTW